MMLPDAEACLNSAKRFSDCWRVGNSAAGENKEKKLQPSQDFKAVCRFRHLVNEMNENEKNQELLAHNIEIDSNLVFINLYKLSHVVKKQQKCRHEKQAFYEHELVQVKRGSDESNAGGAF
jgi:hypothetical protein